MLFEKIDTFINGEQNLDIDLHIFKNLREIIDFIEIYDPEIAHKIEYNKFLDENDTNILAKVFSNDFLTTVMENINDDNIKFNDDLLENKLLFIIHFYNDNYNYFYSETIVNDNLNSFDSIYKNMILFIKSNNIINK